MAYFPDATTGVVIGSAIEVHKALGPGLLESAYQRCLAHELTLRRLEFAQQVPLPVFYKGVPIECGYRLDLIVDHRIVVEIKAVESLAPIHRAQILTYLRLLGAPRGLLINFNVPRLVDGVESFLL